MGGEKQNERGGGEDGGKENWVVLAAVNSRGLTRKNRPQGLHVGLWLGSMQNSLDERQTIQCWYLYFRGFTLAQVVSK